MRYLLFIVLFYANYCNLIAQPNKCSNCQNVVSILTEDDATKKISHDRTGIVVGKTDTNIYILTAAHNFSSNSKKIYAYPFSPTENKKFISRDILTKSYSLDSIVYTNIVYNFSEDEFEVTADTEKFDFILFSFSNPHNLHTNFHSIEISDFPIARFNKNIMGCAVKGGEELGKEYLSFFNVTTWFEDNPDRISREMIISSKQHGAYDVGSSGAPIFNIDCKLLGIHRSLTTFVNEYKSIRISHIIKSIKSKINNSSMFFNLLKVSGNSVEFCSEKPIITKYERKKYNGNGSVNVEIQVKKILEAQAYYLNYGESDSTINSNCKISRENVLSLPLEINKQFHAKVSTNCSKEFSETFIIDTSVDSIPPNSLSCPKPQTLTVKEIQSNNNISKVVAEWNYENALVDLNEVDSLELEYKSPNNGWKTIPIDKNQKYKEVKLEKGTTETIHKFQLKVYCKDGSVTSSSIDYFTLSALQSSLNCLEISINDIKEVTSNNNLATVKINWQYENVDSVIDLANILRIELVYKSPNNDWKAMEIKDKTKKFTEIDSLERGVTETVHEFQLNVYCKDGGVKSSPKHSFRLTPLYSPPLSCTESFIVDVKETKPNKTNHNLANIKVNWQYENVTSPIDLDNIFSVYLTYKSPNNDRRTIRVKDKTKKQVEVSQLERGVTETIHEFQLNLHCKDGTVTSSKIYPFRLAAYEDDSQKDNIAYNPFCMNH